MATALTLTAMDSGWVLPDPDLDDPERTVKASGTEETTNNAILRHPEYYFDDGSLVVLVENVLFRIFNSTLMRHSRFFYDLFNSSSRLPGEACEGTSDARPLKIEGISALDFERLLSILYPAHIGVETTLTADEWTSVLHLATQWQFTDIRALAVRSLQALPLDPLDKIVLSREYGIGSRWTLDAYVELCERPSPLSVEEAGRLGLETATRVAQLREKLVRRSVNAGQTRVEVLSRRSIEGKGLPSGIPMGHARRNSLPAHLRSPPPSPGRQRLPVVLRLAAQTFGLDMCETN